MREPWRDDPEAPEIRAAVAGASRAARLRFTVMYRLIRFLERSGVAPEAIDGHLRRTYKRRVSR